MSDKNKEMAQQLADKDAVNQTADFAQLWEVFDNSLLALEGNAYPGNFKLQYKAANTPTIRYWSNVSDNAHPLVINKHLNEILKTCTKVTGGTWRDIKECDRLKVVIAIHDYTFVKPERPLTITHQCDNIGCSSPKFTTKIKLNHFKLLEPTKHMHRFNNETKNFVFKTKNHGTINVYIPSIHISTAVAEYFGSQEDKSWFTDNMTFVELVQWLIPHTTQKCDAKLISNMHIDFMSWSADKIALVYDIVQQSKVELDANLHVICPQCGKECTPPFRFENGFKRFFLPVSDLDSELL
jgi:hypothetical protein